jgi:hypothetical protein
VDREAVRRVVEVGLAADENTRKLTTETINRLSACGWPDLLALLRQ